MFITFHQEGFLHIHINKHMLISHIIILQHLHIRRIIHSPILNLTYTELNIDDGGYEKTHRRMRFERRTQNVETQHANTELLGRQELGYLSYELLRPSKREIF